MYLGLVGDEPAVSSNHRLLNEIIGISGIIRQLSGDAMQGGQQRDCFVLKSHSRLRVQNRRFGCRCGGRGFSRESVGNGPNTCGHTVGMYPRGASDGPPTDDGIRARPWWVYRRLPAPLSTRATIFAGRAHRIPARAVRGVPSVKRRFGNASPRILRRKKSFVIGRNNAVDEHRHLDAVLRSRDLAILSPNESIFGAAEALSATNSWMV